MMAGGSTFSKPGAPVADLQLAAVDRLQDADALFAAGRYASAIAMGVYALEIHLKIRTCHRLNLVRLPKAFEIHELDGLLVLTGLQAARDAASQAVQDNWQIVADMAILINDLRYQPSAKWTQSDAQAFLQSLRDPPDGVLPWLLAQP
jgi:hypothetical protein